MGALTGAYVKSISADGTVVLQDANGDEQTLILSTGGGGGGGLTQAQVQALVGAMVTGNTEDGIELTYDSTALKIDAAIADDSVGTDELVDPVVARLCPNPTSGTDGQVCATDGTTYQLVDQTGSGGGLTAVTSDSTLKGDGTASDALGLTDAEVNQLDSVPGLLAETADLSIEVISRTWTDGTDVAAGGFVSHGSGNAITVAEAAALTYFVTRAVTNADGALNFVVIRVPDTVDLRDVRTRQRIGGGVDLYIDGWHRIGSAGGNTYAYSHNHLYSGYTARFQTSVTLATTHFRGESDAENVTVDASGFSWKPGRDRYRRANRVRDYQRPHAWQWRRHGRPDRRRSPGYGDRFQREPERHGYGRAGRARDD